MLGPETNLNKLLKIQIKETIFYVHHGIKLEINYKEIFIKFPCI